MCAGAWIMPLVQIQCQRISIADDLLSSEIVQI